MKHINKLFSVLKSDETITMLKVALAFVAFVHAIDEYKKTRRKIGFRK